MYCSTLSDVFHTSGFDCLGYADDNFGYRIFPAYLSLSTILHSLPQCLALIKEWTNAHFLKLNCDKTHVMVFGNKQFKENVRLPGWLAEPGTFLPLSRSVKLLGVHLDDALSFDGHVSKIVTSCYLTLRNLRVIRRFLTEEAAASIVHAFVSSRLDMCNSLFFGMSASNIAKLQHVLNFAIRLVKGRSSWSDTSALYSELHWLTIRQRFHFKLLVLVFHCLTCRAPSPLVDKLHLASAMDMKLRVGSFHPSSLLGSRAFSYTAPRCWNALPRHLRIIPCLDTFKARLKHHLLSSFPAYLRKVNPYSSYT